MWFKKWKQICILVLLRYYTEGFLIESPTTGNKQSRRIGKTPSYLELYKLEMYTLNLR